MEALSYVRNNPFVVIPHLSIDKTIYFFDKLYDIGAEEIKIKNIIYCNDVDKDDLIEEAIIIAENKSKRKVLAEILKSVPDEIAEDSRNIFRVKWKI